MGNERSQGGKLNQRQTLTVTKCGACVPLAASHKALLREQLTAVNDFKICELTWALRPIRFKAAGHQWIYHCCISQEHASGQRKRERERKKISTTYKTSTFAGPHTQLGFYHSNWMHYVWYVMRWGDSVKIVFHLYLTAEVRPLLYWETILLIQL